ncbi:MAG: hypothetical protein ACQESG_02870 [Nanobdellota archaeon]
MAVFAHADCSSLYVPQVKDMSLDIYYDVFWSRASTTSLQELPSFSRGQPVCLQLPESINSVKGDTFWQAWQQYGAIRGYTFAEFVAHSMETNDRYINPVNFDPFAVDVSVKKYYMDKIFNESYQQALAQANQEFLDLQLSDNYLQFLGEPIDPALQPAYEEAFQHDLTYLHENLGLELRFLIIDISLIEPTSLSLPAIAKHAYEKSDDDQVLVTFLMDHSKGSVAISFPPDSRINEEPASFDTIIDKTEASLKKYLDGEINFGRLIHEVETRIVTQYQAQK